MREQFGGLSLWDKLGRLREKKLDTEQKLANKRAREERKKQEEEAAHKELMDYYTSKKQAWMAVYQRKQSMLRDPMRHIRVRKRRASEGAIGLNMQVLFKESLLPIDKMLALKIDFHKKHP